MSRNTPHFDRPLACIDAALLPTNAAIIDVAGGHATLADQLSDRSFTNRTVLNLAAARGEARRARVVPKFGLDGPERGKGFGPAPSRA